MNDYYRLLKTMKEKRDERFAMATVIDVDGSAYRHPGAKMLFAHDGSRYGTISAGCLEEDLGCRAHEVISERKPMTMIYDLRSEDDLSWGQGAGCNGSIKVYVEPCEWEYQPPADRQPVWPQVQSMLEAGLKVASATSLTDNPARTTHLFYAENGSLVGHVDKQLEQQLVPALTRFIHSGKMLEWNQIPDIDEIFVFELHRPRELLYIFGAGPDVEPLARMASALDFFVTVIDPRENRCNEQVFLTADQCIAEHPDSYIDNNPIPAQSYVLVMTHSFGRDQAILHRLGRLPLRYLGVLGPRRRTERLFTPEPVPVWVHSPIGLPIGAEGPEEIGISVMAELLKTRNTAG